MLTIIGICGVGQSGRDRELLSMCQRIGVLPTECAVSSAIRTFRCISRGIHMCQSKPSTVMISVRLCSPLICLGSESDVVERS